MNIWNIFLSLTLGGSVLVAGSIETIFPKLFDSPSARVSAFCTG